MPEGTVKWNNEELDKLYEIWSVHPYGRSMFSFLLYTGYRSEDVFGVEKGKL